MQADSQLVPAASEPTGRRHSLGGLLVAPSTAIAITTAVSSAGRRKRLAPAAIRGKQTPLSIELTSALSHPRLVHAAVADRSVFGAVSTCLSAAALPFAHSAAFRPAGRRGGAAEEQGMRHGSSGLGLSCNRAARGFCAPAHCARTRVSAGSLFPDCVTQRRSP